MRPLTLQETKDYLDTLDMAQALWWFIENISGEHPYSTRLYFYLRERKNLVQTNSGETK